MNKPQFNEQEPQVRDGEQRTREPQRRERGRQTKKSHLNELEQRAVKLLLT